MKELKKISKRKRRKIFLLLIVVFVTAITLVFETYAWFIGLSTVSTSNFDVQVSSAGGLEVSLDGEHWKSGNDKLTISQTTITSTSGSGDYAYVGNTNKWPTSGLVPLSSPGYIDVNVGRLQFYEKTSLSATPGGYRIVANRVDNYTVTNGNLVPEADEYVAFDLFIRNGTGIQFDKYNYMCSRADSCAAESVWMMRNPTATVDGSTNYGAANSLRVGFFLIGGIKSRGANASDITGLIYNSSTDDDPNKVNLINYYSVPWSKSHFYNIWEPNHNVHTDGAVSYFNNACKKRDSTTGAYLSTSCTTIATTTAKSTYSIKSVISASDNVDIYDGHNGYSASIDSDFYDLSENNKKLVAIPTYTSPNGGTAYNETNQLFALAGNSITKVRVYIWLEGQDIDNYDVISKNSNVRISFGLTKDRYGIGS